MRQRPHWLPEVVWIGRVSATGLADFSPVFTTAEDAATWASEDPRRVFWAVDVPADTVVHSVEVVPARIELRQVAP